jgi:predicted secreted protein
MAWTTAAAIYFVIWWIVLFTVLPFGVRNASEAAKPSNRDTIRARRRFQR